MDISKLKSKIQIISRNCAVCGKKINVQINQNKTYTGGHFFGKVEVSKHKKIEYWECSHCFSHK